MRTVSDTMGETKAIDPRFIEIEDLKKRLNNTMEQCRAMQTSNLELRRENELLNKRIEELKLENGAIMREIDFANTIHREQLETARYKSSCEAFQFCIEKMFAAGKESLKGGEE